MKNSSTFLWQKDLPFFRIEGVGSKDFLHGQTTGDIKRLSDGQILPTCWLDPSGKVRSLLEICLGNGGAGVVVLGGDGIDVFNGFSNSIFPADQLKIFSLSSIRRVQKISLDRQLKDEVIWLDSEHSLPASWHNLDVANIDLIEQWRIEQGLPISEGEINGDTNPFELGLRDWVDLDKGCYLGQEAIAKLARSGQSKQILRCWQSDFFVQKGEILYDYKSDKSLPSKAGLVTSSIEIGKGRKTIGLALVRKSFSDINELKISGNSKKIRMTKPNNFVGFL